MSDGVVHYLDYGDNFTGAYTCSNTSNCILNIRVC